MTHPDEEICHVLSGADCYHVEGQVHDLQPGDTIHFFSKEPHRWENVHNGPTSVVWMFSDGLSF